MTLCSVKKPWVCSEQRIFLKETWELSSAPCTRIGDNDSITTLVSCSAELVPTSSVSRGGSFEGLQPALNM